MKNHLLVEKHPNGVQIYLNDKAYAWFHANQAVEMQAAVTRYTEKYQAEVENASLKVSRRHYKLNWNDCSLDELKHFFRELNEVIVEGEYFRAGIGELYLSVKGIDTDREDTKTIEDVLHDFRRKISVEKHLSRRPQPQKRWRGVWIDVKKLNEEF